MGAANHTQHTVQSGVNNFNQGCLHSYLKKEFAKHKFPFFSIGKLHVENIFSKKEANELWEKGIIKKRKGFNE